MSSDTALVILQIFLVCSSLLYCADIFTDVYVSVDTLCRGQDIVIGILMLFFVVVPLIYSNYITQRNRYGRKRFQRQDPMFEVRRQADTDPFTRTLTPYRWDSAAHSIFNVLCILQLGILVDVLEMMVHTEQPVTRIGQMYSHYCYIRRLEVMLENCPQILLQVCALMTDTQWMSGLKEAITPGDVVRLASLFFSTVSLPLALCADEEAGRYCSRIDYDLVCEVRVCSLPPLNLQLLVMYLGFLLMTISRIVLVNILYVVCRETDTTLTLWEGGPNLVTPLCVEVHHLTIFVVYLANQRVQERKKTLVIIEKLKRWNMIVSFLLFSFSEVFLILLQFPQRYRRAIRSRSKEKDKGDERFTSFYLFYCLNLAEFALMAYFCHRHYSELQHANAFFTLSSILSMVYGSIACFVVSGVFFALYHSPLLHPDTLRRRVEYKERVSWWMFGQCPLCGVIKPGTGRVTQYGDQYGVSADSLTTDEMAAVVLPAKGVVGEDKTKNNVTRGSVTGDNVAVDVTRDVTRDVTGDVTRDVTRDVISDEASDEYEIVTDAMETEEVVSRDVETEASEADTMLSRHHITVKYRLGSTW